MRPRLRGWSHAVATVPAAGATIALATLTRGDRYKQLTLIVYGLSSVMLFAGSAAYHLSSGPAGRRAVLQRIDHSNIFLLVAGTYTPIATALLPGPWRAAVLATVWGLAVVGIGAIALPGWHLPRGLLAGCYLGQGWVALAALPQLTRSAGWDGLAMLMGAGLLYTAGAVAYSLRRPRLWPGVFGYHEVFHLLVIAANALFLLFMLLRVVPA